MEAPHDPPPVRHFTRQRQRFQPVSRRLLVVTLAARLLEIEREDVDLRRERTLRVGMVGQRPD